MSVLGTKQFAFVIGSTRSGTSWLHQMLAEHPRIASLKQELSVFSNYVPPLANAYRSETGAESHLNHGLPVIVPREEFMSVMGSAIADLYGRVLARRPEATHILDKRPDYGRHIPVIEEFIPNAKYVHIIRDGREVAISMLSARTRVGGFTDDIATAAREWVRSVSMARNAGERIGVGRYLEVRYEKLVTDTSQELERILHFLDLSIERSELERIASDFHSDKKLVSKGDAGLNKLRGRPDAIWRSRLTLKERYIMDRVAGRLLKQLGYATDDWWVLSASDKRRMWWMMFRQKARRSIRAVRVVWNTPEYPSA